VSGIVAAIGSEVTNVKVGDKVIAGTFNFGAYAQYAKTVKEAVVPLPEGWSFAQGASVLVTFLTAYHCLTQTGYIGEGERVLIHAAAGGVGLAAIQLCKHYGCEVLLRSLAMINAIH
jgi:polyketide synthase 12/candicidin polyketide synthase FscB